MSPKQWLALFCFYICYLFFGATVFYFNEHGLESGRRADALAARIEINELLVKYASPNDIDMQNDILNRVSDYCGKRVTNYTLDEYEDPYIWNYFHSWWFVFIVCSTVGYGNISPQNAFGRIFMIFYALIGMPVNGFLYAYMGDYFSRIFIRIYQRYKAYKMTTDKNYTPRRIGMIAQIILCLIPGIVIFIFIPAILFTYFEKWDYTISVYYAFVTLTTIGFGDFVPTFQSNQEHDFGILLDFYKAFILVWFVFGLGYLVMIMTFIAKGMRSKRIARLEHQLSENIKITQNRIWQGVTKDIGYLRRVLNEVYLMKFKPIYNEPGEKTIAANISRSSSCPNFSMYRQKTPLAVRKRAFSENNVKPFDSEAINLVLNRTQSDTDLDRINKEKTFENANSIFKSGDLLAKVVTALGNIQQYEEDHNSLMNMAMDIGGGGGVGSGGIHGFSDNEILASERHHSVWSLPRSDNSSFATPPRTMRKRAVSDFHTPYQQTINSDQNEWTWSGDDAAKFKEYLRMRKKTDKKNNDLYRAAFHSNNNSKLDSNFNNNNNNNSAVILNMSEPIAEIVPKSVNQSIFSKINPFKKKNTDDTKRLSVAGGVGALEADVQRYLEQTANGRSSKSNLHRHVVDGARRQSVFSILSQETADNEVLEKTTIADLIRALEVVHTSANTSSDLSDYLNGPKRKMGNAGLTPPSSSPRNRSPSKPDSYDNLERRTSLRPVHGYTTIFNSQNLPRKNSNITNGLQPPLTLVNARRTSLRPSPPPYSPKESPKPIKRKFSVRPANLTVPPGGGGGGGGVGGTGQTLSVAPANPSIQASSSLQRRLSLRPSPLAKDLVTIQPSSGRMQISRQNSGSGLQQQALSKSQPTNMDLRRTAQIQASKSTPGSTSDL